PGRELWLQIKEALLTRGLIYFTENMQGALIPEMSGTLIYQNGPDLVLNMSGGDVPEVTLRLETRVAGYLQPGSRVLFTGVPVDFSPVPFTVVMQAKKDEIRLLR